MKLDSLTSLRFFAAFGVVLEHFFQQLQYGESWYIDVLKKITGEGFVWVGFFFVLSGFIISYSYESHRRSNDSGAAFFLYRRFARIYPVHFLMLLVFLAVFVPAGTDVPIESLAMNALLVHAWSPEIPVYWGFNGVSWTLSCEMFFYVSFLFLVQLRALTVAILCVALVAIICVFQVVYFGDKQPWVFYVNPLFRLADFIAGILAYHLYCDGRAVELVRRYSTVAEFSVVAVFGAVAGAAVCFDVGKNFRFDIIYIVPMFAFVFVYAVGGGFISKVMRNRTLLFLGESSFCLYMVHFLLGGYFYGRIISWFEIDTPFGKLLTVFMIAALSVCAAAVLFVTYERPMNKLLVNAWRSLHREKAAKAA